MPFQDIVHQHGQHLMPFERVSNISALCEPACHFELEVIILLLETGAQTCDLTGRTKPVARFVCAGLAHWELTEEG